MKFDLDGNEVNFPNFEASVATIKNKERVLIYGGILENVNPNLEERISFFIPDINKGEYNLYDSASVTYADGNMHIYYAPLIYYDFFRDSMIIDYDACEFIIRVIDLNLSKGSITGTFYGILKNPSDFDDSLLITEGNFRMPITD